jgi:hypothetical protein
MKNFKFCAQQGVVLCLANKSSYVIFFFNPVTGAHTNMLTLENSLRRVDS